MKSNSKKEKMVRNKNDKKLKIRAFDIQTNNRKELVKKLLGIKSEGGNDLQGNK